MTSSVHSIFLEIGSKRVFAGVIDWPGWYGAGRDESSALQSLLSYGARYQRVMQAAQLDFHATVDLRSFNVLERLPGNATTDFGAPDVPPTADTQAIDEEALQRSLALLRASWEALGAAYQAAIGRELRKGLRGGGRELEGIIEHVVDAHYSYLRRINWKAKRSSAETVETVLHHAQDQTLNAITAAVTHGLPAQGARGSALWQPRTFVRRATWHILDHVWEIEDRVQ